MAGGKRRELPRRGFRFSFTFALLAVAACLGLCVVGAQNGSGLDASLRGVEAKPVAFFPLKGGNLDSTYPSTEFKGTVVGGAGAEGVQWASRANGGDPFPEALECLDHAKGLVQLDSVPYGTKGDFSVNLWMKQKPPKLLFDDDEDGDEDGPSGSVSNRMQMPRFEYIFSHAEKGLEGDQGGFFPWSPNQIHVFMPSVAMPAHGIVRAVVKDSTDEYEGTMSQTYLDSDGRFMDNNPRNMPGHVDLEDEAWHMITLTSEGGGRKGYRMYVDGVLAGEAPPSILLQQLESGLSGIPGVQVDGGEPLNLSGKIHLCGRVDQDEDRHFGGNLADLSLWDQVLTADQVAKMYEAIMGRDKLEQRCKEAGKSEMVTLDKIDVCPFLSPSTPASSSATLSDVLKDISGSGGDAAASAGWGCYDMKIHQCKCNSAVTKEDCEANQNIYTKDCNCPASGSAPPPSNRVGEVKVTFPSSSSSQETCSVLQVPSSCGRDSVCLPYTIFKDLYGQKVPVGVSPDTEGKCVKVPVGGLYPPDASVSIPLPVAFFPLTGGNLESWPVDKYKGEGSGVDWVPDARFENSLKCSEKEGSYVKLPNVKYGEDGQFAVNFWMKKDTSEPQDNGFEYIFSNGQTQGGFNPFGPNNLHVYLPEVAHPAHGVARVILKDSASDYKGLLSHTFFDSDGKFMDNNPRNTVGHVNLEDGDWHMFTVTTKANGEPGYQIFVDATLGGSFPTPEIQDFVDTNQGTGVSPIIHVDGSAPMNIDGDIYLCGRADLSADRHFDGQLAHVEIFDKSLSPEMVTALFTAVEGDSVLLETLSDLANSIRALQPNTTEGRPQYLQTLTSEEIINALRAAGTGNKDLARDNEAIISKIKDGELYCSIDVKQSGIVTPFGCEEEGLVCAALHDDQIKSANANGLCVPTPEGGIYIPSPNKDVPVPEAYFPLTGGSVKSWPDERYGGVAKGVTWVDDEFFGSVLQCEEDNLDYVELDNVPYGKDGQWAINFWMAHNGSKGDTFEFLFSHGNVDGQNAAWQPNEVQIYLPEIAHPAHGVVRTIVKDSTDTFQGPMSQTFLDSDGGFMNNMPRNVPGHTELDDGKWHMITLTTQGEGDKGYSVFVDGILGGTSPPAFVNEIDTEIAVDGGDPLLPTGKMYLCGRNDLNRERHFGGRLAHFSFFDESLGPAQIMDMYVAGAGEAAAIQRTMQLIVSQIPQGQTTDSSDPLRTLNRAQIGEACYVRSGEYNIQQRIYESTLKNKMCVDGAVCAPKANSPVQVTAPDRNAGNIDYAQALHGQCVEVPDSELLPELDSHDGAMFFPNPLMNVPTPAAFFPLTAGRTDSWPSGLYEGTNRGATWVKDPTFGSVLSCDAEDNAFLTLAPVPYAEKGSFALNFWFRNNDSTGNTFEYIYSHSADDDMAFNPFYPNQVHVYLPEVSHPAHGVIRTIVKDSQDLYQGSKSETFLDSDGLVNDNEARDSPGHIDVNDDAWHMITLTTRADGGKGYAIFVDGVLGGANFLPTTREEQMIGKPFNVDGGEPVMLDGHIFLCGRNDMNPQRHFKGMLTHLSLFDTALTPAEIAALFVSVKGEKAFEDRLIEIATAQEPKLVETIPGPGSPLPPNDVIRGIPEDDGPLVLRTPSTNREGEEQAKTSTLQNTISKLKNLLNEKVAETTHDPKKSATAAGVIGLFVGLLVMGIVGGLAFLIYKRRNRRPHGPGMVSLPTISRNASTVAANPDTCMSPDESTSNPVSERFHSAQIKMEHNKLSKYNQMED